MVSAGFYISINWISLSSSLTLFFRERGDLISPKRVRLSWLVYPVEKLRRWEVSQVLHTVWGSVVMVVSAFSMLTEEMSVLQPQIETLAQQAS